VKLLQSWRDVFKLCTTQNDASNSLYSLQFREIRFRHSREESVAVIEAGTNHTFLLLQCLGNFGFVYSGSSGRINISDIARAPDSTHFFDIARVKKLILTHTANNGLDNFIRRRIPDMPQCPDVVVARPASIVYVLVNWQLLVESDSEASNAWYRLTDSIRHNDEIDVSSTGRCELY